MNNKSDKLKDYLKKLVKINGKIAVAFSSGVDSTFLLKVAHDTLKENVIAITASSAVIPNREVEETKTFCMKENIKQFVFDFKPLDITGFKENPKNRCYICKYELFKNIIEISNKNGAKCIVEGSNIDDLSDYRPGLQAIKELDIKSPLQQVGLTKDEIRILSKQIGLDTWNKPSFACLASRFPYNEEITKEKLKLVDLAENLLFEKGFRQFRVRIHNDVARIEIMPEEFEKLIQIRKDVTSKFKKYGFNYVSMDLNGYITGSMNKTDIKQ